jgi:hypothetical protein
MYTVESFKCKACFRWLPPFPKRLCCEPAELECPSCKQRCAYAVGDFLGRIVAFTPAENPVHGNDMHWVHVKGLGVDFFAFVSEKNPVAPAIQSALTAARLP